MRRGGEAQGASWQASARIRARNVHAKQKGLQRSHRNPLIFLAGQEGFEPPSLGFGVRCSSR